MKKTPVFRASFSPNFKGLLASFLYFRTFVLFQPEDFLLLFFPTSKACGLFFIYAAR